MFVWGHIMIQAVPDYAGKISTNTAYHERNVLYEVRCLKSNEDMILAIAGQFKQFFWFMRQ